MQKKFTTPRWWGSDRHKLFTVAVFIVLASLDNAARGVFPPLYAVMARDFAVKESSLGFISAVTILVVAVTAVGWGYWGDRGTPGSRSSRKRLLLYGTLIWSMAMLFTGLSQTYTQLFVFQVITAVGIGCISSVGFSVVNDFISPVRRGLAMSFWGLSQGGGGGAGAMLGGLLGAHNWPLPFFVIAGAGFLFAGLYLFTFEPERGRAEPELASVYAAGGKYKHHIEWRDIKHILTKRSNLWLMVQAFLATLVYGSLVWMPRLFIAKLEAQGYSLETATMSGNLLSLLFQTGFYFAILAGHLGDKWERRRPGRRAVLAMLATLAAIPFQIAVFFIPLHNFFLPDDGDVVSITLFTLLNIATNPWVGAAFVVALFAVAFSSADVPNRNALLSEVNLPEHRGTAVGLLAVAIGLGVALGNALTGLAFNILAQYFDSPDFYVVGLALFQLMLIPAGLSYYRLSKTAPADTTQVRQTLAERAKRGRLLNNNGQEDCSVT